MIYSFTLPLQLLDPPPPHVASFPSYESGGGARSLGHLQLLNDFSQWVTADAEVFKADSYPLWKKGLYRAVVIPS